MNNKKKSILVLVSLVLLLCFGAGGTLAFLIHQPDPITNEFQPTEVTTTVEEKTENGVKSEVKIKNTGTTEAYIRAAVVITWQDENGNVYGQLPVAGEDKDYTISYDLKNGWSLKSDGFYYWKAEVEPGEVTGTLITSCAPVAGKAPEGYNLCVEIIASGIQSKPAHVVQETWKVTVDSNGNIS